MMAGVPLEDAVRQAAEHHTTLGEADLEAMEPTAAEPSTTSQEEQL
jgi:simple sugar transport system ATP-binding protein